MLPLQSKGSSDWTPGTASSFFYSFFILLAGLPRDFTMFYLKSKNHLLGFKPWRLHDHHWYTNLTQKRTKQPCKRLFCGQLSWRERDGKISISARGGHDLFWRVSYLWGEAWWPDHRLTGLGITTWARQKSRNTWNPRQVMSSVLFSLFLSHLWNSLDPLVFNWLYTDQTLKSRWGRNRMREQYTVRRETEEIRSQQLLTLVRRLGWARPFLHFPPKSPHRPSRYPYPLHIKGVAQWLSTGVILSLKGYLSMSGDNVIVTTEEKVPLLVGGGQRCC